MLNRFSATGNLTQDPQLIEVKGDYHVCKFSIAINNPIKKSVLFMDIETWNKTALSCHKYISKGSCVAIDGKLESKQWQGRDGQQKNKIICVADSVTFLRKSENYQPGTINSTQNTQEQEEDEDEVPF
jgi:single-strand DNA-binding protein